jgi:carbonic anhydrase
VSDVVERLVGAARRYADAHRDDHHVDVRPRLALVVITCMDSRIDLFGLLGLDIGDAHVLRNAGGVVTDDMIRSLVVSQRALGTTEVVLVHHTDCGMQKVTDDAFKADLEAETGQRPAWALESFTDPVADVRQSMARIRSSPFVLHRDFVRGFVYDVDTCELVEVDALPPG